jgi:hypothetical protein
MSDRRLFGRPLAALVLLAVLAVAAPWIPGEAAAAVSVQQIFSRVGSTAGETLAEGDVVMVKSDGKAYKADADDATLRPAIGVIGKGGSSGDPVEIVTRGIVGGLSSLTKGGAVFLSTTAAGTTQTAPATYAQRLGWALSATEMALDIAVHSATGFINIPLAGLREIVSSDIDTVATGAAKGSGGILGKDSTPILERVNGATDQALRVKWAAANTDAVTFSFAYPPDLDDAAPVVVNCLAKSGGATDTPTITVAYFEKTGDTDAGGATGALSSTLAKVSRTIAAGDIGAYPAVAAVTLTPGAHGTDTVELYAVWIEYTRK